MSNKKLRPDVLRDATDFVGGPDKRRVVEVPSSEMKQPSSLPDGDPAAQAFLRGAGKRRFSGEQA